MQGAGIQVQVLRFALLIVLTVALASVAVRINSHSSSSSRHGATPSSGLGTHSSAPQSPGSQPAPTPSPSVKPTHVTRSPRTAGHAGGGAAPSSAAGRPQELPVTGWDPALKLGALAFVLIGGGLLTVRAAGPRPRQRVSVQD